MDDQTVFETTAEDGGSFEAEISDQERDFYRRLRAKIDRSVAQNPQRAGVAYLAAVPDLFYLMVRLVAEREVPIKAKALLGGGVAYFFSPIDVIPDFLPFVGWLDDLILAAMLLNRALEMVDPALVQKHWAGKTDLYYLIKDVLQKADTLVSEKVLKRIRAWLHKLTA